MQSKTTSSAPHYPISIATNLRPIKRDYAHSHPGEIPEHLVDWDIIWSDPSDPREVAERGEDVPREEVPAERAEEGEEEEFIATHASTTTHAGVVLTVEGVEEGAGNKGGWPDYTSVDFSRRRT